MKRLAILPFLLPALSAFAAPEKSQSSLEYYWKTDAENKKATACQLVDTSKTPDVVVKDDLPLSDCIAKLPMETKWVTDDDGKITGCQGVAKYRQLEVDISNMSECVQMLKPEVSYLANIELDPFKIENCETLFDGMQLSAGKPKTACSPLNSKIAQVAIKSRNGSDKAIVENTVFAWLDKNEPAAPLFQRSRCML